MAPKDIIKPTARRLRTAVTDVLNAHHLLGVLDLGAPADEYDPEMKDVVRLIEDGSIITPEMSPMSGTSGPVIPAKHPDHPRPA